MDDAIGGRSQVDGVMPVKQTEHGLQQMITILALADDVQKQVDLGRCRESLKPVASIVQHCWSPIDQPPA